MNAITGTRARFHRVTSVIGAEVEGVDLSRPLDAATIAAVKQAVLDHKVLIFRDQKITDEDHLRFSRYFGPLTPAHPISEGLAHHPEIWERGAQEYRDRLSKKIAGQDDPAAKPPREREGWHIDITFVANPNHYSILRGVEIPEYGGDTLFADLEAVYDTLSPTFQKLLDGLQAVHGLGDYDAGGVERKVAYKALHPLVRVHPETGRKSLFLNVGVTNRIVGLSGGESRALLDYLKSEIIARADCQARVRWHPDTLVIWDNRATSHAGPIDYAHFEERRVVRRTTVAGELPVGADGFVSRALEGPLFGVIG
jgi:taurine dioxygenase